MGLERLVLFDIDGTLVKAGQVARDVCDRAIEAVLGGVPAQRVSMSGKTDPQIVREYLALADINDPACLPAVLEHLERELAGAAGQIASGGHACSGAGELLSALSADERLHLSVLTGNIAPNALVKLAAFGLEHWLDMEVGAYGSDSEDRNDLVPIALDRLATLRRARLSPADVWVVGDTPLDLECARAGGAHCLLVATGMFSVEQLVGLGADAVLPNFSDTGAVVGVLTDGL